MLMILLVVYVVIALFVGHVMVGITYKPNLLRNIAIRVMAFGWPLYPVAMVLAAWASK